MMDVCKRVLFWVCFAVALGLDIFVLKNAPQRAAALLLAGQLVITAWSVFWLALTVRPSSDGNKDRDEANDSKAPRE